MTPLLIIGVIVAGVCWIIQLFVSIESDGSPEKELAILTLLGLSFIIVVISLALGTGV